MKRTYIAVLLACAVLPALAQEKLRIIDLGEPEPPATQAPSAPAQPAAVPTSEQARGFIERLNATVDRGMEQLRDPKIDPVQRRRQAQALAALQDEAQRFGVLFTPFHKCNEAAIDAASSWQGLIGNNAKQFDSAYDSYLKSEAECREAAEES